MSASIRKSHQDSPKPKQPQQNDAGQDADAVGVELFYSRLTDAQAAQVCRDCLRKPGGCADCSTLLEHFSAS